MIVLGILAPIIVLGIVIFVHELGHFLAAKAFGVYAPRFSIGFGPALWKRRWGETEYRLSALPLGGYVRMASRDDETMAQLEGGREAAKPGAEGAAPEADAAAPPEDEDWDPEALVPFGPKPVPDRRWFESKPIYARVLILLAGVTMNYLLAVVIAIGIIAAYGRGIVPTRVVGGVEAVPGVETLTEQLQVGDTILAVDGDPVENWNQVVQRIARGTDNRLVIRTSRGDVVLEGRPDEPLDREALLGAIDPWIPPVIGEVVSGYPAAGAGMQVGDSLVAVEGRPVRSWSEAVVQLSSRPGDTVRITFARGDTVKDVALVTHVAIEDGKRLGKIGVSNRAIVEREDIGLADAVVSGWRATWGTTVAVAGVLGGLVTGRVSVRQLGGPVAIGKASVQAGRSGIEPLLQLIAFISINLAILNLLPIPILDGGQILMVLAEGIKGRPITLRTREMLMRIGLAMILLIFVLVTFNDVLR